jgi:hypothetical protein
VRLRRRDHGQFDKSRLAARVINPLRGLALIFRPGPEDVGREGLRIAVVEQEPDRLNLRHYAAPRQEDVARRGKRKAMEQKKRDKTSSKSSKIKLSLKRRRKVWAGSETESLVTPFQSAPIFIF